MTNFTRTMSVQPETGLDVPRIRFVLQGDNGGAVTLNILTGWGSSKPDLYPVGEPLEIHYPQSAAGEQSHACEFVPSGFCFAEQAWRAGQTCSELLTTRGSDAVFEEMAVWYGSRLGDLPA